MVISSKHNAAGLRTYLWGSLDTGSMYTHSLLLKVLSIQGFLDCEQRAEAACEWRTEATLLQISAASGCCCSPEAPLQQKTSQNLAEGHQQCSEQQERTSLSQKQRLYEGNVSLKTEPDCSAGTATTD